MALNGAACGAAIKLAVDNYIVTLADPNDLDRDDLFEAMGNGIVDYIVANNAVTTSVPGTGLVAPVGGGPVTGTAKGTGTFV